MHSNLLRAPERGPQRTIARPPPRLPQRLAGIPTLCPSCQQPSNHQVDLDHDGTGRHLRVCRRCLRSAMRMQADRAQGGGGRVLREVAEENGWQVWSTGDVVYLLPSIGPFDPTAARPSA